MSAFTIRPIYVALGAFAVVVLGYMSFRVRPAVREIDDAAEGIETDENLMTSRVDGAEAEIARLTPLVAAMRARKVAAASAAPRGALVSSTLLAWAKEAGLEVTSLSFAAASVPGTVPAPDPEDASVARPEVSAGLHLVADGRFPAVRAFTRRLASEGQGDLLRFDLDRRTDGGPGIRLTLGLAP